MKTFAQWSALGRRIHRGSKAAGFENGEPLFREDQTYNPRDQTWVKTSSRLGLPEPGTWNEMPY
jgi:hypothetical protein